MDKSDDSFGKRLIGYATIYLAIWVVVGLVPLALVVIGRYLPSFADSKDAEIAGTIGDAFGMANSLFSGAALLLALWSIFIQRKELKDNTESQLKQAELMRQAADLTAINHIYAHYNDDYAKGDQTEVRSAIARGHRRWAIRESFNSVDQLFKEDRAIQVQNEAKELRRLLANPQFTSSHMQEVAVLVSSLLVDKRVDERFRKSLWPLYEVLRENSPDLYRPSSAVRVAFEAAAADAVDKGGVYV